MFKTIRDRLYTVVNALVGSTPLSYVYNYDPKSLKDGYVVAVVSPVENIENVYDTAYNQFSIPMQVNVFMPNDDPATNEGEFLELIDEIMVALRTNETLSGATLGAVFRVRFGYTADESPLRFCQILCIYTGVVAV